jgi:tetratricopeptide (TPR) repeat protein
MSLNRTILSLSAVILGPGLISPLWAQVGQTNYAAFNRDGLQSYSSLPARASAMGRAYVAVSDDLSALFSNPAGLGLMNRAEAVAYSSLGLLDSVQETIALGIPVEGLGAFGISGDFTDYGMIPGRDESGSPAPDYSVKRLGLQVGWGMALVPETCLGLAVQGHQQNLAETSYSFFSAHLGVLQELTEDFKIGLSYRYDGFGSTAITEYGIFNLGFSYRVPIDSGFQLLSAAGGSMVSNALDSLQAGVEASYLSRYFLRASYQASLNGNGVEGLSGLTLGAGMTAGNITWNYAFLPYGNLGNSHRLDVGYRFDSAKKPAKKSSLSSPGKTWVNAPEASGKTDTESSAAVKKPDTAQVTEASSPGEAVLENAPGLVKGAGKDSLTVQFSLAPDLVAQGEALENQGNTQKALALYRQAAQEDSQNALAWWRMGNLYVKLKQKNLAIQCFEKALKLKPNNQALADWLSKYKASTP